ncbi:MAG: cation diffusion facilitator family transporter [Gemmatimonadales bacterium]|nr:cation diffusion facilitator family transporter [Gemmatimonadales bacterium]
MSVKAAKLGRVLLLTAGFAVVEVGGGILSGSLALLADAGHMFTDVGALALAWFGARLAARRVAAAEVFGNRRWEVLAALLNGLLLFVIGVGIALEAVERLRTPRPIDADLFGSVAAIGLVVNLVALRVLHGDHHHDLNVRGAYLHILSDLLGSAAAIVAALVIRFTGWTGIDPIASVLICLVLLGSAGRLVAESAHILLDRVPKHLSAADLERAMLAVPGVQAVHDLHVWHATPTLVALSAHAVVPDLAGHPDTRGALERALLARGIGHVTLQLELGDGCAAACCGDAPAAAPLADGHAHPHAHRPGHVHAH